MTTSSLPDVLVIDDLFGRRLPNAFNRDREHLCGKFLLIEKNHKGKPETRRFEIPNPVARAVFYRGQIPNEADVGDVVENDLEGSLAKVREGWTQALAQGTPPWSMVLLDLCFYTGQVTEKSHRRTPGMPEGRSTDDDPRSYFGLQLLDAIHREFPELPVFILSSKPREEVSLEFSRRGALGFIDRSDRQAPEQLEAALWNHGLLPDSDGEVVGNSLSVLLALREARRAAAHRENVLIRGERGTGKELMARFLHRVVARQAKERPFVIVNSAVFTPNLFSSELFGIEPRTATGVDGKVGLIESAKGGDLFLDEIADMPSEVQAAALRVLQDRQITRVGGRHVLPVDVRFLSATNADLEEGARGFRLDLLDRLRLGGTVWLPPLRERPTDIPLLVERFVREAEAQRAGVRRREVTSEAMDTLKANDWPGNIRELRTVIFDAVSRHPDVEHLVPRHLRLPSAVSRRTRVHRSRDSSAEETVKDQQVSSSNFFNDFLHQMTSIDFGPHNVHVWAGRLAEVQQVQSQMVAQMVRAAIEATKRRTPDNPAGQIQIHPAFKLLTGDTSLTASKAADLAKRLLGPLEDELTGDLAAAYQVALRLRPKTSAITKKA